MKGEYIEANGHKLYYEIHGEGEPLLLIMGIGGDLTGWGLQIPAFEEHFSVIAFDNRDAGRSSQAEGPYLVYAHDFRQNAEAVDEMVEQMLNAPYAAAPGGIRAAGRCAQRVRCPRHTGGDKGAHPGI